jgi:hypothetical protein
MDVQIVWIVRGLQNCLEDFRRMARRNLGDKGEDSQATRAFDKQQEVLERSSYRRDRVPIWRAGAMNTVLAIYCPP